MKKNEKLLLCLVALLPFSLHVKAEHAHTWSNWEVTCPATCNYEGVKIRYCTECYEEDAEDIPATGKHDWSKWYIEEPSCFTPGSKTRYCEYCNKEEEENIPARGYHTWGKWQILEKADCLNDGEKYRICTVCGKEETQKIPANKNSHNYGKWHTARKSTAFKKLAAAGDEDTLGKLYGGNREDPAECKACPKTGDLRGIRSGPRTLPPSGTQPQCPFSSADGRIFAGLAGEKAAFKSKRNGVNKKRRSGDTFLVCNCSAASQAAIFCRKEGMFHDNRDRSFKHDSRVCGHGAGRAEPGDPPLLGSVLYQRASASEK